MVAEGNFREDLYYRLNVLPIVLPPLRERREDVPLLTDFFFKRFARERGIDVPEVSPAVRHAFDRYRWPGNVRELENACERIIQTCSCGTVRVGCLARQRAVRCRRAPKAAAVARRRPRRWRRSRSTIGCKEVESNLIGWALKVSRRQQVEGRRAAQHQALDARRSHRASAG